MQILRGLTWQNIRGRGRALVVMLMTERASPKEVGQAVAIGVWMGTSPAMGLHGWLAVGLATLLKRNRGFAFLGSRVSFFMLMPWIVLGEIEAAHWLRTGTWAPIDRKHVVAEAGTYLLDWCLGWLVLGPIAAVLLGALSVPLWAWWQARKRRSATPDTQLPPPQPSSESPP